MPDSRKQQTGWAMMIACLLLAGCVAQPAPTPTVVDTPTPIRLLALGDSYTIGESVGVPERWPVQLAAALRERGIPAAEPVIVAQTGWTTGELLAGIEQQDPSGPFDLVSLLIGVNNQYRGGSLDEYRSEFRLLLQRAIAFTGGDPGRVIVLSIPDWGVTPFASSRDRERIASQIDQFNEVNREEAESAGAHYADITPISRQAATDRKLVAADGLHPSGMMYSAWVPLVLSKSLTALGEASPSRSLRRTNDEHRSTLPTSEHFDLKPLADGIYAAIAFEGSAARSNAGIIDLGEQTLVFDTFDSVRAAEDLRAAAEHLTGREATCVIISHAHADH